MHTFRMAIILCILLVCIPPAYAQNSGSGSVDDLFNISDPDALALALIPYLKNDNPDIRELALANIIYTKSKLPDVLQAEKELLNNEPPGEFRDLLELGIQVSSGTSPISNQTAGEETSELQGSEGLPEITQGGCYKDPNTGEMTCVDATGEPVSSSEEISGSKGGAFRPTGEPSNSWPQGQGNQPEGPSETIGSTLSGNSALGNSAEISSGQSVKQAISPAGSWNWYKIKADSNGILSVKISDVPKDMRPQVRLHDKNFALFEEKIATSAGDDLKFKKDVPMPGWMYIAVYDADGKAHADPYTLTVDLQPVQDSFDPNNVLGDAAEIQLGQAVTASICPKGESDWYKIKIDSNAILSVNIVDVPEDMRSQIKLYDKNFALFEEKLATSAGDDLKFERDVPVPGWIYLAVYDAEGKAHAEPYTLTVA